jgi:16S rRNA U516 pseudouridylate synthase RsuA-like enzyme
MCAAVGHPVLDLRRLKVGNLGLGGLPLGRWRYLEPKEVWSLLQETEEGEKSEGGGQESEVGVSEESEG